MRRDALLPAALACTIAPVDGADNSPAATPNAAFADATDESGVAEVVKAHYRNVPKWWLSGLDLIDLDGDGDLDHDGDPDLIRVEFHPSGKHAERRSVPARSTVEVREE